MQTLNFKTWFDIFTEKVRAANYRGPIDRESAEMDYDDDKSPEAAAADFVIEMTD